MKKQPQWFCNLATFQDPNISEGMKLTYRLKGEPELHSLWFPPNKIPQYQLYLNRLARKLFDWYEWKPIHPYQPICQKTNPKINHQNFLTQKTLKSEPNLGSASLKEFHVSWIFKEETQLYSQVRKSLTPHILSQLRQQCSFVEVTEQLAKPEPEIELRKIELNSMAGCICHETGIKFAVDLQVPVKFHFQLIHPLALWDNAKAFVQKYQEMGIKLESLESQILAGLLIVAFKHHKLFGDVKTDIRFVNEKLTNESEKEILAKLVKAFFSLKSGIGMPKFNLTTDFYLDKQLLRYLSILKGEDESVGNTHKRDNPTPIHGRIIKTESNATKLHMARKIIGEMLEENSSGEIRLFLLKLKANLPIWQALPTERKLTLIKEIEDKLPITLKGEILIQSLSSLKQEIKTEDAGSFSQDFDENQGRKFEIPTSLLNFGKKKDKGND
jgi:hypothetical protein